MNFKDHKELFVLSSSYSTKIIKKTVTNVLNFRMSELKLNMAKCCILKTAVM